MSIEVGRFGGEVRERSLDGMEEGVGFEGRYSQENLYCIDISPIGNSISSILEQIKSNDDNLNCHFYLNLPFFYESTLS